MGREIRRVVPNWEHPRRPCEHSPWAGGCDDAKRNGGMCYRPLFDEDYENAANEWLAKNFAWERGEDPDRAKYEARTGERRYYWEWTDPPDRDYFRPKWLPEEMTWFQMYETVSEGTPVTPPFATKAEIVDYLVKYGDSWDQNRGDGGWLRENAESFVEHEWAPSAIGVITGDSYELKGPRDGIPQ